MKVFILSIFTLFICFNTQARKPAVEDFVGIIPDTYKETPKGTEVLFDFKDQIKNAERNKILKSQQETNLTNWTGVIGLGFFLALPFLMWTFITKSQFKHSQKSIEQESTTLTPEDDSTVKNLEDYRFKQQESNDKKAS